MTISTIVGNPFSILFVVCNFAAFYLFKIIILSNVTKFGFVEFLLIILLSTIAGTVYSLIDIKLLNFLERHVIKTSGYYDEGIECNLFYDYGANYIFEVKENNCNVYIHANIALAISRQVEMKQYIEILKYRILTLNKMDKLFIYSYKYGPSILLSIACFSLWQIARCMSFGTTIIANMFTLLTLTITGAMILFLYFMVNEFFLMIIDVIMQKRNLRFFISE